MLDAAGSPGPQPAPGARLGWIDTARGLTMVMVVLLHADVVATATGHQAVLVTLFDSMLFPLRMPLFFLVSGLLSAALLRRTAGEVLRRRVLHYAWLYALWSALYALLHAWVLRRLGPPAMEAYYNNIETPLEALLVTWNNTWFLYALLLFYAAALALRRLPPPLQAALALAAAVPGLFHWGADLGLPVIDRFYHFPYFMLGILGGARLRDAVPRLGRPLPLLALLGAWLALAALAHHARILRDNGVVAALSLLAVPAGLAIALLLTRHAARLARPLQVIGRNTLAIYVLHTLTLRLLMALVPPDLLPGVLLLPLLSLGAIALALLVGRPLERWLPILFGLPGAGRGPLKAGSSEAAGAARAG